MFWLLRCFRLNSLSCGACSWCCQPYQTIQLDKSGKAAHEYEVYEDTEKAQALDDYMEANEPALLAA